ncbi:membrane protein [Vallitalea longa]|uniref:Membrane protein n=1 Tax=Vallitalea longa TaxID=2936439 RepID=A0A9W5YCL9_9FIRM|nr:ECF transporter S component [Vallitalea longa]GKX29903.1 membrane protein [Vallitalea longa]
MKSKQLVYTALFAALGVVLPQMFHVFGNLAGSIFLPMHIPVLLAGFVCGPISGLLVGLVSVLISHVFTGMPPVPNLFFMIVELPVYGLMAGLLFNKYELNIIVSLISAMVTGRIVVGFMIFAATNLLGITLPKFISFTGMIVTGLPGIALQLVVIPSIMVLIKKVGYQNATA